MGDSFHKNEFQFSWHTVSIFALQGKDQLPIADFTVDPKDNSVIEHLYYPQEKSKGIALDDFLEKHFKAVRFKKVIDPCSHHDQFIHYNKAEGLFLLSHKILNKKRLVDIVAYSKPEIIEKRLQENKTKKCGF